jgi:hypothetical protein
VLSIFHQEVPVDRDVYLFEFDRRFETQTPHFVFFDFHKPREIPAHLLGQFAGIILDPPYLNPDCLKAFASAVFLLAKDPAKVPVILCTGSVMCSTAGYV